MKHNVVSFAARDLAACLAVSDERKRDNAQARTRMQGNAALVAALADHAMRRGEAGIDWDGYFSRMGVK